LVYALPAIDTNKPAEFSRPALYLCLFLGGVGYAPKRARINAVWIQLEHCIIELPRVRSCFVQAGGPIFADEYFVCFQARPDFVRKPMNRWPMAGKL
jgi:hypothetical protein